MDTTHKILNTSAAAISELKDKSIALIVTSPPYPMIEMWDNCFSQQSKKVTEALKTKSYDLAFEEMHAVLATVWQEMDRVLMDGGFACINIGDATRNCEGNFKLFSNHAKIIAYFSALGYSVLPDILWRKQTNAPNKFMGSGMYPAGAYVTLEHEYILIFRKGKKREFVTEAAKLNRRASAYFWEERNLWFSDTWDFKGTTQKLKGGSSRARSGAYPFELAYRLINMFSVKGDTVLDPFVGTGTTLAAAMASERNSVGVEIDATLCEEMLEKVEPLKAQINAYITTRLQKHLAFIEQQKALGKEKFYTAAYHNFSVKTRQEVEIVIKPVEKIVKNKGELNCSSLEK